MKNWTLRTILTSQIIVLTLFFCMTVLNEYFDLPRSLLGQAFTAFGPRTGEICMELAIFTAIMGIELLMLRNLYNRIRLLEGFLPICASCKKIRHDGVWEQVEKYITEHSLVKFSHSICPECAAKLYPDYCKAGRKSESP